jgi:hypothetical protein
MNILDYTRSFITFEVSGNRARIALEATCCLEGPEGQSERFLLFASCKSEDTYAERDLFRRPETEPNYDFSGLYSDTRYRLERIHADCERERPETGLIADRFVSLDRHLVEADIEAELDTPEAVVRATLDYKLLVARTVISHPDNPAFTQTLEFPVKTMNVNPETLEYQTDTGPVPLYDFSDPNPEIMARFRWAYVAFNHPGHTWFVYQAPTDLVRGGVTVAQTSHYSRVTDYPAVNTLYALRS